MTRHMAMAEATRKQTEDQFRSNDTHASWTDSDARLYRRSGNTAAILCYQGHVLIGNRNAQAVSAVVTHVDGIGEHGAALQIHPDCLQSVEDCPNTVCIAARRVAMNRQGRLEYATKYWWHAEIASNGWTLFAQQL